MGYQDLRYVYDPAGNPVEITDALTNPSWDATIPVPNTREFFYDARYRLVRAKGRKLKTAAAKTINPYEPTPASGEYEAYDYRYAYDAVGNFTKNQEYSRSELHYKGSGRIDLFNGDGGEAVDADPTAGNFQYDANGNTTKTPRHAELAYTHDNQVRYVDKGGNTEVRDLRHGDQRCLRLVKKNGVRALGVYLGPWEYHERVGTNAFTKTVLHVEGHGRHAQSEVVLDGTDSSSLALFFVHGDHLGSGHVLTKADGTLLSQEEYFPYGRASDRRDARNRYRYIGVERDEDTGLCMTGPRTYDPVSGRFLQADPLAERDPGRSPLNYAGTQVLRRLDPSGYQDAESQVLGTVDVDVSVQPVSDRPVPLQALEVGRRGLEDLAAQAGVEVNLDAPTLVVHPSRDDFLQAGELLLESPLPDVDAFTDPSNVIHLPPSSTKEAFAFIPHEVAHASAHEDWLEFTNSIITPVTEARGGTGGFGVRDTLDEGATEYLARRVRATGLPRGTRLAARYDEQVSVVESMLAEPGVGPGDLVNAYFNGEVSTQLRSAAVKALTEAEKLPSNSRR